MDASAVAGLMARGGEGRLDVIVQRKPIERTYTDGRVSRQGKCARIALDVGSEEAETTTRTERSRHPCPIGIPRMAG